MTHTFFICWEPNPRDSREGCEIETAYCRTCSLTIERPDDLHMMDECPPVERFTLEWFQLLDLPASCEEQCVLDVHAL